MRDQYFATSQGFIGVYSITSRDSFYQLQTYLEDVAIVRATAKKKYCGIPFPLVIAANKCDLPDKREVSTEEGKNLAKSFQAPFVETSARKRINEEEPFYEMVREIRKSVLEPSWWGGKYRSSVTFFGDQSTGLSDLVSHITHQKVQAPVFSQNPGQEWNNPYRGTDLIFVNSPLYPNLTHRVWASDPRIIEWRSTLARPMMCFLCFSVVNRTSFERVIAKWNEIVNGYRKYQIITILVGTRTDVRDWLTREKKTPESLQPVQHFGTSTPSEPSSYQPFNLVPEEIVVHIFSFLPMLDNVIFTCRRFAKIAQHPSLESIRWGMIQLPFVTRKEAEEILQKMQGTMYVECSVHNRTGLEELSLHNLFEKYSQEAQRQFIKDQMNRASKLKAQTQKKKKKRFLFF